MKKKIVKKNIPGKKLGVTNEKKIVTERNLPEKKLGVTNDT
jgi:hypothetical protein